MADYQFFKKPIPMSLAQIAAKASLSLVNAQDADFIVEDVATLDCADSHHLAFLDNKKFRAQFEVTRAGAVIIHPDMLGLAPKGARILLSDKPYKSYAIAAQAFYPLDTPDNITISKHAVIHPTAKIGNHVSIGDFSVVGADAEIGDGTWIESHVNIGQGVKLGQNCRVGTHSSITHTYAGQNVRFYTGVRIGQDGFGFAMDATGFVKVPQLGRVIMGDNIEVGANTCIDRGAQSDTIIGSGTWIDNLVQIAHNVKIGRGCVIVSQCGIAGSSELGDFVVLGGQVGVSGHLKIGTMARVAAKSGVTKDIPAKEEWMGYPAMPMKKFLRQTVMSAHLADKTKS